MAPHDATWRARTRDVAVSDASRGGAAGNAVTLSTVRTRALLAAGPALTGSGSLTLEADQDAEARSRATLVALTFTDHRAIARSDRDIRMSGPVTVWARNRTTSASVTNPAVDGPGVSPALVVALLRELADHVALSQSAAGTGTAALPALGSAVVDSIALNVVHHDASAVLPDGITVLSGGPLGVLADSFLTAVATGGSAGGPGPSADHTAVAVNLVRRIVVVVVSRESESAGDLTVRAGRGPPGTELISATSPSHPGSTTLNQVASSVTTTVRGTTSIDSTTGATPVAAPQTPAFTPPAGSVLITSRGGTVRLGAATLTFAPGTLAADTWILIRLKPGTSTGVLATSAVYELLAFDAATGQAVTTFTVAPVLSVEVGSSAGRSSIYYLDPELGPVAMTTTVSGGTVTAALPHFSEYVVGTTAADLLDTIVTILGEVLAGTHTQPYTVSLTGDRTVGGVLTLSGLSVTFSGLTHTGTGSAALWTGSVTVSATGATLGTGSGTPFLSTGAVSATYTLTGDLAGDGDLVLTAADPVLTLGTLARAEADALRVTTSTTGAGAGLTQILDLTATGVTLTVGSASGPHATLEDGTLGLEVRDGVDTSLAFLVTGDVTVANGTTTLLTATGWRFGYNELTGLSTTPVVLPLGDDAGDGTITLDLPDGTRSLSGSGSLDLGIGTLTATWSIVASASGLSLTVTEGTVTLAPATGVSFGLEHLGGRLTLSSTGITFEPSDVATGYAGVVASGTLTLGTAGSVSGTFTFAGAPGAMTVTATGVTLTVGQTSGVHAVLSNASLGLLVRTVSSATRYAVLLTGDVRVANGTTTLLSTTGWRFGLNELDDLDSTPAVLQTGAGGLTLDLADGEASLSGTGALSLGAGLGTVTGRFQVTATTSALAVTISDATAALTVGPASLTLAGLGGRVVVAAGGVTFSAAASGVPAFRAAGTLSLGTLGQLTGTFTVVGSGTSMTITAEGVSASLAAGPASFNLAGGAGLLTVATAGTTGSVSGAVSLTGVPGLEASGTLALTVNTAASTFSLGGSGSISVGGVVGLTGTLAITRSTTQLTAAVTSSSTTASVVLSNDGTWSATGTTALSLPVSVPGVSLSGTATIAASGGSFTLTSSDAQLVTPAGTISGTSLVLSRNGQVWDISGTGLTLAFGGTVTSGAIGVRLTSLDLAARLLADGALVLRGSGTIAIDGTTTVTASGTLVAAYNPTDVDVTLGATTVAAHTTSVGGGVSLVVGTSGVRLSGDVVVTRQGTGDLQTVTVTASGVSGQVGGTGVGTGPRVTLTGGALDLTLGNGSYRLTAGGVVGLAGVTGVSVSGGLEVSAGTGLSTTVRGLGLQVVVGPVVVTGSVTLDVTGNVTTVHLVDAGISVGDLVSVTDVTGTVTLGASPTIALTGTAALDLGPIHVTGPLSVTDLTGLKIGNGTTAADLAVAGQHLRGISHLRRLGRRGHAQRDQPRARARLGRHRHRLVHRELLRRGVRRLDDRVGGAVLRRAEHPLEQQQPGNRLGRHHRRLAARRGHGQRQRRDRCRRHPRRQLRAAVPGRHTRGRDVRRLGHRPRRRRVAERRLGRAGRAVRGHRYRGVPDRPGHRRLGDRPGNGPAEHHGAGPRRHRRRRRHATAGGLRRRRGHGLRGGRQRHLRLRPDLDRGHDLLHSQHNDRSRPVRGQRPDRLLRRRPADPGQRRAQPGRARRRPGERLGRAGPRRHGVRPRRLRRHLAGRRPERGGERPGPDPLQRPDR